MKECDMQLSQAVIGCAIEVHRNLGPGLLEKTYEQCLAFELNSRGIPFRLQVPVAVRYKQLMLDCSYRLDILVDDCLILELKSVEQLNKLHEAQILTYMKLAKISTGLLINFNETRLSKGIKRYKQ